MRPPMLNKRTLPLCLGIALLSGSVHAGPADYVYMPTVDYGEKEIDFKFGTAEQPSGETKQVASLGLGYGATDWWFTEVYIKTEHESPAPRLNILELENKFQLTETGKYPLEVGLITEFEFPLNQEGEPYEFKFGPLFQTEFDKLQLNGNLLLETKFGEGNPTETAFLYQWQAKYRWHKEFEFGLQGFGETGEWDDWAQSDEQEYKMGPAIFGKVQAGDHAAIKYNAAWLIGMTDATPDNTFRVQVEYEF
ncbi:MAG: hypothetical protein B7Z35_05880 [Hydrogenophilales bacterium 12-61-10]|nr:MAG: hypothetical protein B7Z35_05880 [Hydrogenophilales bacterium 12-61-10]